MFIFFICGNQLSSSYFTCTLLHGTEILFAAAIQGNVSSGIRGYFFLISFSKTFSPKENSRAKAISHNLKNVYYFMVMTKCRNRILGGNNHPLGSKSYKLNLFYRWKYHQKNYYWRDYWHTTCLYISKKKFQFNSIKHVSEPTCHMYFFLHFLSHYRSNIYQINAVHF